MNQFLREVELRVTSASSCISLVQRDKLQRYHNSQIPHLGLSVPEQRAIFKKGYSFSELPEQEQLLAWDYIWHHAEHHEVMSQALYFCEMFRKKKEIIQFWPIIKQWVERVDNWDHSDELSDIYSRILEFEPDLVYQTLIEWNGSENPWKRRQSLISLIYYSSTRKTVLPADKIIPLINNIILDTEYYVQKAIGWTLRELHQVYPKDCWQFLVTNISKISSIAFSTAIEKYPAMQKNELKRLRRS